MLPDGTNESQISAPTAGDKFAGTWFDPTHDGEGFVIQILEGGSALVFWYTYDGSGNQLWILGTGSFDGTSITISETTTATGGMIGNNFNSNDVVRENWGGFSITFNSCTEATLQYNSIRSGFGSGQQNLTRLTSPKGLECNS